MENRIVEISRKKARNRVGKKFHADLNAKGSDPAFFARKGVYDPPRFPLDINPERRGFSPDSSSLHIISVANTETRLRRPDLPLPAAIPPKPAKTVAKRKSAAKKAQTPRVKAKADKKVSQKKPRVANMSRAPRAAKSQPNAPVPAVETMPPLPCTHDIAAPLHERTTPAAAAVPVQPVTPLPRANSVTLYRKNNMFNVLGYWLRTQISDISKLFAPRPKRVRKAPAVAQVLAENAALRKEIARLRSLQSG
jgi:hypothetical protein